MKIELSVKPNGEEKDIMVVSKVFEMKPFRLERPKCDTIRYPSLLKSFQWIFLSWFWLFIDTIMFTYKFMKRTNYNK